MQLRDQLRSTEKLEKQIRVLEERKQRAVYSEMRVKKVKDKTIKETKEVKELSRQNKEKLEMQVIADLQQKRAKVDSVLATKGRGYDIKIKQEADIAKQVAYAEEEQHMKHARKLEQSTKKMMTLEEIEQQLVKKL